MKTALTIAGSDSGGGAGIQADLKTFSALGVYGMSAITAVTAQNTQTVTAVENLSPDIIERQIRTVFDDMPVHAVKIGMVSNQPAIDAVAATLRDINPSMVVLDPVMISKSGHALLEPEAKTALIENLLPLATVVTPNLKEAEALVGEELTTLEDMEQAAVRISKYGAKAVLVKGGHLEGEPVDVFYDGTAIYHYSGKRIHTKNTHGTGCTLSSAITAHLANGTPLTTAVKEAKNYIEAAIEQSLPIGEGSGPTHHFHRWFPRQEVSQ